MGIDDVLAVNEPAVRGLLPDLTLVLAVDPETSAGRLRGIPDRIEVEGLEFQRRVATGFAAVAHRFPERIRVIDGERDVAAVAADVATAAFAVLSAAGFAVPERA